MDNEKLWIMKNSMLYEMATQQPNYNGSIAQKINDIGFSILEHNLAVEQDYINNDTEPSMIININRG